jgi:hypothetical protein
MENKEIKILDAFYTRGLTIIPVVEICLRSVFVNGRTAFFYSRKPILICIATKHNYRAVDINGDEIPVSRLIEIIPEIETVLHSLSEHI